jgi:hypothetical protein
VALLCYRLARRLGAVPLHAFVLSIAAQMVHFTFPDNLALYWELSTQAFWFLPAIAILLIEERACDGRTLRMTVLQSLAVFAMTYFEWIRGTLFLAVYFFALLLIGRERLHLKRIAAGLFLPWFVAIALYNVQLTGAEHESARTGAKVIGSRFLYRTGLDGDTGLYGTHLDIAFGREWLRAYRPGPSQYLFHWPSLFFAGALAVLAMFLGYARGKAPSIVVIALSALTGTYVLFAAIFSQAVAMHPYQYDLLLATPLIVALFALLPAFIESHSGNRGAIVLIMFLTAVWLSMFQLRLYAMANPLNSFAAKASRSQSSISNP